MLNELNTVVIAIAQEDKDLESHGRFLNHFEPAPRFEIVADLNYQKTRDYGRTSTYFIDTNGIVRQVFPSTIRYRADWDAVLGEVRRLVAPAPPE